MRSDPIFDLLIHYIFFSSSVRCKLAADMNRYSKNGLKSSKNNDNNNNNKEEISSEFCFLSTESLCVLVARTKKNPVILSDSCYTYLDSILFRTCFNCFSCRVRCDSCFTTIFHWICHRNDALCICVHFQCQASDAI